MTAKFTDGLQRLLDFANYLRCQRLLFHISQESCDAITVSFGTFADRFSLDFFEQSVSCRRYRAMQASNLELREIQGIVDAGSIDARSDTAVWPSLGRVIDVEEATPRPGGMRRLLEFTAHLRARGVVHTIEQQSCDALEVSFSVEGKRIEVEFSPDQVLCSVFCAEPPCAFDEAALRREVEVFTRPYHPAMRMRGEMLHASE